MINFCYIVITLFTQGDTQSSPMVWNNFQHGTHPPKDFATRPRTIW